MSIQIEYIVQNAIGGPVIHTDQIDGNRRQTVQSYSLPKSVMLEIALAAMQYVYHNDMPANRDELLEACRTLVE